MGEYNWGVFFIALLGIMVINYVIVPWAADLWFDAQETRKRRSRR